MNDILRIYSFELKKQVKTKSFLISLLVIFLLIMGFGVFVKFMAQSEMEDLMEVKRIGIVTDLDDATIDEIYDDYMVYENEEEIKTAIGDEEIEYGLVIKSLTDVKVIVHRLGVEAIGGGYTEPIRNHILNTELAKSDLSLDKIEDMRKEIKIKEEVLAIQESNPLIFVISFISTVAIYMLIILSGTLISNSITSEKQDRTMEILLTSTRPEALIHGKVFASLTSTLIQLLFISLAGTIAFLINIDSFLLASAPESYAQMGSMEAIDPEYIANTLANVDLNISPLIMLSALVFFITGFILYVYIYAALGATANKTEELNAALTPIMMIVIVVYMATFIAIGNPDGKLMTVLSFIPFSSVFTAYIRYSLTDMGAIQLLVSYLILLATTIFFVKVSVKLYRLASLNYGNTGWKSQIKALFTKAE